MHVAVLGERVQHAQLAGREPREAEQREARRQVGEPGSRAQPRARAPQPRRRVGHVDPRVQPPPQLRLPVLALAPAQAWMSSGRCSA